MIASTLAERRACPDESSESACSPVRPLKTVRPSLLDLRFKGDVWLVSQRDGPPALFLGGYQLVTVTALSLDLPTLNQLLDRARHVRPRWQKLVRRCSPCRKTSKARSASPQ